MLRAHISLYIQCICHIKKPVLEHESIYFRKDILGNLTKVTYTSAAFLKPPVLQCCNDAVMYFPALEICLLVWLLQSEKHRLQVGLKSRIKTPWIYKFV